MKDLSQIKVISKIECDRPHLYDGEQFDNVEAFKKAYEKWKASGKTFTPYQYMYGRWVILRAKALQDFLEGKPL